MKKSTEADIEYFKGLSYPKLMDAFSYYDNISIYFKPHIKGSFVRKSRTSEKFYIVIEETEDEECKKKTLIFLYACIFEGAVVTQKEQASELFNKRMNKFVEEFNALYNK